MRDKILNLLEEKGDLPPLPDIILRLQEKIDDPQSSISDIAKLIELEPIIAGKILKLSNSVFYARSSRQIKTLPMAINKLGLKMIIKLVYSLALSKLFVDSTVLNNFQFWRHSLAVALFTQALSRRSKSTQEEQDIAYLSGLMHDVGIMVFSYLIPDEYSNFLKNIRKKEEPLEIQEQNTFGINHPEVGSLFIEKWWQINGQISLCVRQHHFPFQGTISERHFEQLVNVANGICNNIGITNGINCYTEVFKEGAWEGLGLSLTDGEKILEDVNISLGQAEEMIGFKKRKSS